MSEWSQDALRRSNERQEAKQITDAKAVQDRTTLTVGGKNLWADLRSVLLRMCAEFNDEPGQFGTLIAAENSGMITVSCKYGSGKIVGALDRDTIAFKGENGLSYNLTFTVRLTTDQMGVWLADKNGQGATIEAIADGVIAAVLEGCGR